MILLALESAQRLSEKELLFSLSFASVRNNLATLLTKELNFSCRLSSCKDL